MKEWTREERYRVLKSKDEIAPLYEINKVSNYRQKFHVQPITGLSNDPNGFIYHQGKWHLFYQWCPWGAVHGLKYWYHVVSKDLIHWENEGVALAPDTVFDNKGCYSGTGISSHDQIYVFYTGNHRDENWVRKPYTCVAKLNEEGKLIKKDTPLFAPREDYTEHQRDPMIVYVEEKQKYFIFIGARSNDGRGTALVYSSSKLLDEWSFQGELRVKGYEEFGGMWECPCLTTIGDKDVLIFSPQYTKLPGRGECTNHNIYFVGKMDYDTLTFIPDTHYRYLDYGFDFYAAQMAANVEDKNKGVMIAWMGLPDNHYPTEEEQWEGSLTLPREIFVEGDRLIQKPIAGFTKLRTKEVSGRVLPSLVELEVKCDGHSSDLRLFTKKDGSDGLMIHYDSHYKMITVDKSHLDKRFNEEVFEALDIPLDEDLDSMSIFIDQSSVELFINDGKYTFTAHVYPTEEESYFDHDEHLDIKSYELCSSVDEDFIV